MRKTTAQTRSGNDIATGEETLYRFKGNNIAKAGRAGTHKTRKLLRILKTTKMTRRAWCQQNLNRVLRRLLNTIKELKIN